MSGSRQRRAIGTVELWAILRVHGRAMFERLRQHKETAERLKERPEDERPLRLDENILLGFLRIRDEVRFCEEAGTDVDGMVPADLASAMQRTYCLLGPTTAGCVFAGMGRNYGPRPIRFLRNLIRDCLVSQRAGVAASESRPLWGGDHPD